jgi:hypothetical protein
LAADLQIKPAAVKIVVMPGFIGLFDTKRGKEKQYSGGDGGIRTLDRALQPYNGLANRRLQPLGHVSVVRNQALSMPLRGLKP